MPSFAELKAKAAKTTSSGVEKLQNMKDRNTSVSMKKTNWDPYSGTPPPPPPPPKSLGTARVKAELAPLPPPPSRTNSVASRSAATLSAGSRPPPFHSDGSSRPPSSPPSLPNRGGQQPLSPPQPHRAGPSTGLPRHGLPTSGPPPPPLARGTKPGLNPREHHTAESSDIDWTNLSQEDKEVFFSWLDEFFSGRLNITLPPRVISKPSQYPIGDAGGHVPPPVRVATKPTSWHNTVLDSNVSRQPNKTLSLVLSHPPAAIHGSAAADLAEFYRPNNSWDVAWYSKGDVPPPLEGNTSNRYTSSWQARGNVKTSRIGVLFSDLSVFWGSVQFAMNDPENTSHVQRGAQYLPRPVPLDRVKLLEASETYGETIASFAESFLGTNQYCARGECWDLANEALKYFDEFDYIPKPVPSISRTHGHLVYEGKASSGGQQLAGRWRGGDDRIRRGDIVEWRRARIATVGSPRGGGGWSTLGDPDHTAIIVKEAVPLTTASDGASLSPPDLGKLTVVEQSVGQPPAQNVYDLRGFEEGEVWIYRPVSLEAYVGIANLAPDPPAVPPPTLQTIC